MKNVQSDGFAPMLRRVSRVTSMSRALDRHITMTSRSARMRPFFLPSRISSSARRSEGAADGKAHVDDVDPGVRQHARQLVLLLGGEGHARRLLAVAEGGVVEPDLLRPREGGPGGEARGGRDRGRRGARAVRPSFERLHRMSRGRCVAPPAAATSVSSAAGRAADVLVAAQDAVAVGVEGVEDGRSAAPLAAGDDAVVVGVEPAELLVAGRRRLAGCSTRRGSARRHGCGRGGRTRRRRAIPRGSASRCRRGPWPRTPPSSPRRRTERRRRRGAGTPRS